jgi:folliculin-interacting protein 2
VLINELIFFLFVHSRKQYMIKCWHQQSQWLVDLFSAPRLVNPVWLSLSTGVKSSNALAHTFTQDLSALLNTADTKDTNFFISTLLTAVLTHHLGWVGTVAPLMTSNVRDNLNKNGAYPFINKLIEEENFKLSEISKIYPYNALWAQLGDLYGAITCPIKLSKTIICGSESNVKIIEKLLNIMTYFIRCSEIRRNAHTKIFDKDQLNKVVNHQLNQRPRTFQSLRNSSVSSSMRSFRGLTRTATTVKDLSLKALQDADEKSIENFPNEDLDPEAYRLLKILKKNVMNDIPKVLAFRDSRFVKQELRIGNKSMDTGIEMPDKDRQFMLDRYHVLKSSGANGFTGDHKITLTVTRPDSIEEAIELDDDAELTNQLDFISLSNLITENSLGGGKNGVKMFWENDQFKDTPLNLEQIKHLERISAEHQERVEQKQWEEEEEGDDNNNNVVFVLGDDEKLIGLKSSASLQTLCFEPSTSAVSKNGGAKKKICKHNRKPSGVKFNFEKYPQIATNYMKSKNLEFSEPEVIEKGLKLDRTNFPSTLTLSSQTDDSESDDECECSRYDNGLHYLQTPSNATELEFTSDSNYLTPSLCYLQTLDENKELGTRKSSGGGVDEKKIIEIPMLDSVKSQSVQDEILKPGFTSSLFTSISDHYIADMILQVRND